MKVVGVDGCKPGWLAIWLERGREHGIELHPSIPSLWQSCSDAAVIFIDIPIGLPNRDIPVRACDQEARALLGPGKASSVFPAPSRQALPAATHEQACHLNRAEVGRGVSLQCFHIRQRIREVDELLRTEPAARQRLREVHPEVCFLALNGGRPMQHRKKTPRGYAARLCLLKRLLPQTEGIVDGALDQWFRKEVAKDDILDALVAAVTALEPEKLASLPAQPSRDAFGLPMEIVYRLSERSDTAPRRLMRSPV